MPNQTRKARVDVAMGGAMKQRKLAWIAVAGLGFLGLLAPSNAPPLYGAPATQRGEPPPPAALDPAAISPEELEQRIGAGDWRAVPVVRKWLAEESLALHAPGPSDRLRVALHGVGAFGLDSAGAALVGLYDHPAAGPRLREQVVLAASGVRSEGAKSFLVDLLKDGALSVHTRLEVARALAELDDDAGRKFLLDAYDTYLTDISAKRSWDETVRSVLERMHDPKLVASLEAVARREPPGVTRNNARTLLDQMAINAMPVENLLKLAEDDDWSRGMYKRYPAIAALGQKAGPEVIPRLLALKPWPSDGPGANAIQQQFLKEYAGRAVADIRRRHWEERPDGPGDAPAMRENGAGTATTVESGMTPAVTRPSAPARR